LQIIFFALKYLIGLNLNAIGINLAVIHINFIANNTKLAVIGHNPAEIEHNLSVIEHNLVGIELNLIVIENNLFQLGNKILFGVIKKPFAVVCYLRNDVENIKRNVGLANLAGRFHKLRTNQHCFSTC
jgi:hypothetical protein